MGEESVGDRYSLRIEVSTSASVDPRDAASAAARARRSASTPLKTPLWSALSFTRNRVRRVNTRGNGG